MLISNKKLLLVSTALVMCMSAGHSDAKIQIVHSPNGHADKVGTQEVEYKALQNIDYQEYIELKKGMQGNVEKFDSLGKEIKDQEKTIEEAQKNLSGQLERFGSPDELVKALKDKTNVLNTLTEDKASFFANLSAFVYEDSIENACKKHAKETSKIKDKEELKKAKNTLKTEVQTALRGNVNFSNYDVVDVIVRNGGEFSGMIIFDKNTNEMIFDFKGTVSKWDWMYNLSAWNKKASAKHGLLQGLNFHSGFLNLFEEGYDQLIEGMGGWLAEHRDRYTTGNNVLKLFSTGHSLGGALAMVFQAAAMDLAKKLNLQVKGGTVTFAAPNILNSNSVEKFRNDYFGGDNGNIVRIEDSNDIVPTICFFKDKPGVSIKQNFGRFYDETGAMGGYIPVLSPHSMVGYYHGIRKVWNEWETQAKILHVAKDVVAREQKKLSDLKSEKNSLSDLNQKNIIQVLNYEDEKKKLEKDYNQVLVKYGEIMQSKDMSKLKDAQELKVKRNSLSQLSKDIQEQIERYEVEQKKKKEEESKTFNMMLDSFNEKLIKNEKVKVQEIGGKKFLESYIDNLNSSLIEVN